MSRQTPDPTVHARDLHFKGNRAYFLQYECFFKLKISTKAELLRTRLYEVVNTLSIVYTMSVAI